MRSRVLTAAALAPVVLGALFLATPYPLLILSAVCAYIGGREVGKLLGSDQHIFGAVGALAVILVPFADFRAEALAGAAILATILGVAAAWLVAKSATRWPIVLAPLWCVAPLASILVLHRNDHPELFNWTTPVLLAILPLWGGDTAAIFAGKAFGKHKLAPGISPNKTVEGSVANLLACVAVAVALAFALGFGWITGVLCGLAAGILGQAGDLFESWLKRQAGVKDSGTLLPGHGGLLDRIDSILFTAPAVALIVIFSARQ